MKKFDIVIITTLPVEFNVVVKELNLKKSENELEAYGSINNYDILYIKSTIRGNIESKIKGKGNYCNVLKAENGAN